MTVLNFVEEGELALDEDVNQRDAVGEPVPSLVDILNGKKSANAEPVVVDFVRNVRLGRPENNLKVTPVKSTIKFAVKASVPIEGTFQKTTLLSTKLRRGDV